MTVLERIAEARRRRVAAASRAEPVALLKERCAQTKPALDAFEELRERDPRRRAIIAEVKRRSPSAGQLRAELDPGSLARAYAAAGACAVSVLREPDFFGGSLRDVERVRAAVELPLLYKDFVVDPYQLWEARSRGADLVLLIVALLRSDTAGYVHLAREVGLEPLVEVHDREELEVALEAGARLVGINNRNLKTLAVDVGVSRRLLPLVPADVCAVAESGLRHPSDLDALETLGARAFLVGEALVRAEDPGAALTGFVEREG
jgi:indole-3-glycerol phosphate synthase